MKAPPAVRVVIADDHPMFRDGLRRLLESEPGFSVVGEAATPLEAVAAVRRHTPDVLLLDLLMPGGGGLAALKHLASSHGPTHVVLLTAAIEPHEEAAAARLGVRGIVTKESATATLFECLRAVMAGECWLGGRRVPYLPQPAEAHARGSVAPADTLTHRELEIVSAVADGASNRDIAERLGVSQQTVKNHLGSVFDKLGVSTRLELALYALSHDLVSRRPPGR